MRHLKKNIIRSYIDRELSGKKRKEVEKHLDICPKCQSCLKNASQNIDFIKKQLSFLAPEKIPSSIPQILKKIERKEVSRSFLYRFIFSSVRVPSLVLVIAGFIILTLSALVYSGNIKTEKLKPQLVMNETKGRIEMFSPMGVRSIPLDFEIGEFTPIENPNILVLREDEE
jgi:anti-sigma factor RsiW